MGNDKVINIDVFLQIHGLLKEYKNDIKVQKMHFNYRFWIEKVLKTINNSLFTVLNQMTD